MGCLEARKTKGPRSKGEIKMSRDQLVERYEQVEYERALCKQGLAYARAEESKDFEREIYFALELTALKGEARALHGLLSEPIGDAVYVGAWREEDWQV
jgi:hypothetical protein